MDETRSAPLISCLCITENRVHKLKMALDCFLAQTYPNKELVIVYREDDRATSGFIEGMEHQDIIPVKVPHTNRPTLGELRNISLNHASGEYFCQWDDDDWYHCERLTVQFNAATGNQYDASVLVHLLMYNEPAAALYLSYYRPWEGSILCRKAAFGETVRYPAINKGEDTEFTNRVLANYRLYPVTAPHLYIYVYHGANSWEAAHFERLFTHSQRLSGKAAQVVQAIVGNELPVAEASALLNAKEYCAEFDYFFYLKTKYLLEKRDV